MSVSYRLLHLERTLFSVRRYGVSDGLKLTLGVAHANGRRITLPNGMPFAFRGRLDQGAISHLYLESYRIDDSLDRPIRNIVDGGANIGVETARFLHHHPQAEIVALEAERENFDLLSRNFGSCERVKLIHAGLWPIATHLTVVSDIGRHPDAFHVIETEATADSIPSITISQILEKTGWNQIDILKLDIEGAEDELFSRLEPKWMEHVNAIIIETHDNLRPGITQKIFRALQSWPAKTQLCGENLVMIKQPLKWQLKLVRGIALG
jgi:FkbM family methyltransferase